MRRLVYVALVVLVTIALGGTVALAEPANPEVIDEADMLRVQLAQARAELAERAAGDARQAANAEIIAVRAKYKLGDADAVDTQTRVIKRAPKPEKPATAKK